MFHSHTAYIQRACTCWGQEIPGPRWLSQLADTKQFFFCTLGGGGDTRSLSNHDVLALTADMKLGMLLHIRHAVHEQDLYPNA